jgi:type VII secretion integral membrane protein EccD
VVPLSVVELTCVTVDAGGRRLDVCVPGHAPVADLLPDLLRRAAPAGSQDGGPAGAWRLGRLDGRAVAADLGLAEQGVTDGTVLYLVPGSVEWPHWECDDVVEVVAATATAGRTWGRVESRVASLLAGGLCLTGALVAGLPTAPGHPAPPVAAATLTALLAGLAALAGRAGDRAAATVLSGAGAAFAAAGGLLLAQGPAPARLACAAAALALYAGALAAGTRRLDGSVAGTGLLAALALAAAGLAVPLGARGAAVGVLCLCSAGVAALPAVAVRLARIPLPVPGAGPAREPAVAAAVRRADTILTGLLAAAALAGGAAGLMLLRDAVAGGRPAATAGLLAVAGAVPLLRSRGLAAVRHRVPPVLAGAAGVAAAGWFLLRPGGDVAAAGLVASGLLLVAVGSGYRRPVRSPYAEQALDLAAAGASLALVPAAAAALGLFDRLAALAG